ncbi:type II toxin-antitoxin system HipA family toxin [Candidatus Margulisiibacteriota bacterium]
MIVLSVFWGNKKIGKLWSEKAANIAFQYDEEYLKSDGAKSVSLSLPLQSGPVIDDKAKAFFANLLPEGDIRHTIAQIKQVSEYNDISLLKAIGGECAGALSLLPEGMLPEHEGHYKLLSENELMKMLDLSSSKPLLVYDNDLRLSLAGAQDKLPVYIADNQIFLPKGNLASTHIIKHESRYFPDIVENEYFCMQLARYIGLDVPDVELKIIKGGKIYIIERYDRNKDNDGKVSRIHQEDFCQCLNIVPAMKYESDGGPGLVQCFELLDKYSIQPIIDRKKLIEWMWFNCLIGNADAHAKNISMVYQDNGLVLAPFYDLMSTIVYPELSKKMAMKTGGENRYSWIKERHLRDFAESISVKPDLLINIGRHMASTMMIGQEHILNSYEQQHGENKTISKILQIIKNNAESTGCMENIET